MKKSKESLLLLISRTEKELKRGKELVNDAQSLYEMIRNEGNKEFYWMAMSLLYCRMYAVAESILGRLSREIDSNHDRDWQEDLLLKMNVEIKSVRPAVIRDETYQHLEEFRKFRHQITADPKFLPDGEYLQLLYKKIPVTSSSFAQDMLAFSKFLSEQGSLPRD